MAQTFRREDERPVDWAVSATPIDYPEAVAFMEERARAIAEHRACELVWLLEHPALYTAGVSAKEADLLDPDRLPVHRTGAGGSSPITAPRKGSPTSCST